MPINNKNPIFSLYHMQIETTFGICYTYNKSDEMGRASYLTVTIG